MQKRPSCSAMKKTCSNLHSDSFAPPLHLFLFPHLICEMGNFKCMKGSVCYGFILTDLISCSRGLSKFFFQQVLSRHFQTTVSEASPSLATC